VRVANIVAIIAACVVALAGRARADGERCTRGVDLLHRGDLPHAALYLDGCDDGLHAAARRELRRRLDASALAVGEIVSRPAGLDASIDALPGERFTTPATVWVPAGSYHVRAGALVTSVTTKPRARSVVYLDAGAPAPTANAPAAGRVDFSDDNAAEPAGTGPPPDVEHGTMLPCKFAGTCATAGDHLDDPFAARGESPPPAYPRVQLELRVGGMDATSSGLAPTIAFGVNARAPWQDAMASRPWSFEGRYAWDLRGGKSEWTGAEGLAKVVAATDTAWLALGAAFVYSSVDGAMASVLTRLALRRAPVMIGASFEQGIAHTDDRAVIVEVGGALRR
jgi:hypothetical protein